MSDSADEQFTNGPSPDPSLEGRGEEDPEILALLDFQPVPRRVKKLDGWTPALQRLFIAKLAVHGSPGKACDELGKYRSGVDKLAKSKGAESFRAACDGAVELAERRRAEQVAAGHASVAGIKLPFVDNRRKAPSSQPYPARGEGQILNEFGEWEDEDSLQQRAEAARSSVANKLLRARRLYLQEISGSPGHRAAFEILTELPVDWGRAERLEPQPDEPWRTPNARNPDLLLTAEAGWLGEITQGPDKKAELRKVIDKFWAELGRPPIEWGA
jgi:hypothetical protein